VGPPDAQIMLVGEAPGAEEDAQGEPFRREAGQALTILLRNAGLDRSDVYITNIVKCRPPENRDPHPDEVQACREYLDGQIACIRPHAGLHPGALAGQTLLDDPGLSVMKANGTVIEPPRADVRAADPSGGGPAQPEHAGADQGGLPEAGGAAQGAGVGVVGHKMQALSAAAAK
jgi:uracil-DNA glycosylase family 4